MGRCPGARRGNDLQPRHGIFEVLLLQKEKVSEVSEELRSALDAVQAFRDETLPAASALRLSGNLIPHVTAKGEREGGSRRTESKAGEQRTQRERDVMLRADFFIFGRMSAEAD